MRGGRGWKLPAAVLLGTLAGHAAAGEAVGTAQRTVAGAQEFLRQALPGNRYVSSMMSEIQAKATREGLRSRFEPLPVIVDADPVEGCRSYLVADIRPTRLIVVDPAGSGSSEAWLSELAGDDYVGRPDGMHFGSIRALRQDGPRVHLRFAGEQVDAVLHLEGEEIAGRVRTALDFLRQACDATAATGF